MSLPTQGGHSTNTMSQMPGVTQCDPKDETNPTSKFKKDFEADLNADPSNSDKGGAGTWTSKRYLRRPLNAPGIFQPTLYEGPAEQDNTNMMEANRTAGSLIGSSLLSNYLNGAGNEFVNIKLTIRGDPYWIDPLQQVTMYFIFASGFPDEPGLDGLVKRPVDSMFTGLFKVITIKSSFSAGKFTQLINANRDILTKIEG